MHSVDGPIGTTKRAPFGFLASLSVFLLILAGCSLSETSQEEEGSAADRPNIVFVLTDDLDYASTLKMPQITSLLAEEGLSFEQSFVSHPVCCPSRATILTGLYDHNHDVRSNRPPDGAFQKFFSEGHEENSIAVRLQEGGYRTAFFGKYFNGYPNQDDPTHVPPGWDEWYGKMADGLYGLYDYDINENGEVVSYGSEIEDFYTDVLSGQAIDFVSRATQEDRPFFAYVAPTAPHWTTQQAPPTPAERHEGAFAEEKAPRPPSFDEEDVSDKPSPIREAERITEEQASNIDDNYRQRQESMLAVDEMVASLVDELEAAGELENTYIVFTSDNGYHLGEHRIPSEKDRPYEESVRVPLFVRGPGIPAESQAHMLTLNTDFAPTFAELAGVEGFSADGRSLVPLLGGEEPSSAWRSSVLLEKLPPQQDSSQGKAKGEGKAKAKGTSGAGGALKGGFSGQLAFEAVRTETHKYVEYDNGDVELYDVEADPYELESIHESADPALLEDLKAKLEALKSCSEEGCREAEDAS